MTTEIPVLSTARLRLAAFAEGDLPALSAILAEPEVAKGITVNTSTPERARASAERRIAWHNRPWGLHGYGGWAVKAKDAAVAPQGALLGWCGFIEPDIGDDPELVYGLAPAHWGRGLAQEAGRAAIAWLFAGTAHAGVSAVVFSRINPGSGAVLGKLGLKRCGTMAMADFLPEQELAKDVLDYEIWRLASGACRDPQALIFQAPYKAGQIASLGFCDKATVEAALCDAALRRDDYAHLDPASVARRVREAFFQGLAEPEVERYRLARIDWQAARQTPVPAP